MGSVTELSGGVLELPQLEMPRPMMVAENAHVTYQVYASGKRMTARDAIMSGSALRGGRGLQSVHALRGVSFTASEGETIGVVGHNGSGKSTLFRAMTGLIPTSEGAIWARDRPVLLGVNAALIPELSGENNIRLGLLAMGYTAEEAAASVDEIADFAELNEFIHHPMRTYSSGMGARLRFAIASAKAHSILLIDEALSVGDRRFKIKSEKRIRELRDSAGLVMIVSHSVGSLKDTCERVLWVHKGELVADGAADDVIDDYIKWTKKPGSVAVGAASPSAKPKVPAVRSVAPSTPPVVVPPENERTAVRRARYRRTEQQRRRRRLIAVITTGAAILLAAGAGAAVALLNTAPPPPAVETSTPVIPGPAIASFTTTVASAVCATQDGEAQVPLNWSVDEDATAIALAIAGQEVDALDKPLHDDLPTTATGFAVAFPCSEGSRVYTLTAENAEGGRTNATVIISRTAPPSETPTPTPTNETDATSNGGGTNSGGNTGTDGSTDTGGTETGGTETGGTETGGTETGGTETGEGSDPDPTQTVEPAPDPSAMP